MISICMTLKDRAVFVDGFLRDLGRQDYDLKKVEICVSDGFSTDSLIDVLKEHKHKFLRVLYATSDRSKLPFEIVSNNPACDINAQICWMPTFEKIIRIDPEVRFSNPHTLSYVSERLSKDTNLCLNLRCAVLRKGFKYPEDGEPTLEDREVEADCVYAFYASCFNRSAFIRNRGVDERFALGFAGEDSFFHLWWRNNSKHEVAGPEYIVYHLWHPSPSSNEEFQKIRHEYTIPLLKRLLESNEKPNSHLKGLEDMSWMRPEMLGEIIKL